MGDQCASCFELHRYFFPYLLWPEMCAKNRSDEEFHVLVQKALHFQSRSRLPDKDETVATRVSIDFEVCREFKVATEKELKKHVGQDRIAAKAFKFVPQISMPNETGKPETLYVFAPEVEGLRTGVLKVKVSTEYDKLQLAEGWSLSEEHTQEVMRHCINKSGADVGIANLMDKLPWLQTVSNWQEKKIVKKETDNEEENDNNSVVPEQELQFVGPAAATMTSSTADSSGGVISLWQRLTPMCKKPAGASEGSGDRKASITRAPTCDSLDQITVGSASEAGVAADEKTEGGLTSVLDEGDIGWKETLCLL